MKRKYVVLTYTDRMVLEERLREGWSLMDLAFFFGVHISTMYHEVERGGGEASYSADKAQAVLRHKGRKKKEPWGIGS